MTILEMNHISKAFGGSKALSDVHITVEKGEIHALLGENGAGKSTLMNILTGVIPADEGSITFLGKQYPSPTIRQMEEAGIAFVHQELNVINDLSVSDNIFLCRELRNKLGIRIRFHDLRGYFASIGAALGVPDVYMSDFGGWRRNSSVLKEVYQNVIETEEEKYSGRMTNHFDGLITGVMQHEIPNATRKNAAVQ